jgi:[ribosomal protein S5]-alanine N-acetyltransferase
VRIELPIETEHLVIRELVLSDAEEMGESPEWIAEKIDRYERDDGMSLWAVAEKSTGLAVGLAGLQWEDLEGQRVLDLGCVIGEKAQLRGIGTEASEAVVQAAFATGFDEVTAMTKPDNAVALHVLENLGFEPQGEATFEATVYTAFVRRR